MKDVLWDSHYYMMTGDNIEIYHIWYITSFKLKAARVHHFYVRGQLAPSDRSIGPLTKLRSPSKALIAAWYELLRPFGFISSNPHRTFLLPDINYNPYLLSSGLIFEEDRFIQLKRKQSSDMNQFTTTLLKIEDADELSKRKRDRKKILLINWFKPTRHWWSSCSVSNFSN